MTWRTSESAVRSIIETDSALTVTPFIDQASVIVDDLVVNDVDSLLSVARLELIERNLAAHFYSRRDPQYQSKATAGASATFQGQTGMGYDSTYWGQDAKRLDLTGRLALMDKEPRAKATMVWLGKPPSTQLDYEDRD